MCPLTGFSPVHPGSNEQVCRVHMGTPTAKNWVPVWSAHVFCDRELYAERHRFLSQADGIFDMRHRQQQQQQQYASRARLGVWVGWQWREPEAGSQSLDFRSTWLPRCQALSAIPIGGRECYQVGFSEALLQGVRDKQKQPRDTTRVQISLLATGWRQW